MDFLSTSNNDLLNLNDLACDLKNLVDNTYSHVKHGVPKTLLNQLNKFKLDVEKEVELRNS